MIDFNHVYSAIRGSDIDRDGMCLEIQRREGRSVVLEIFYSDTDSTMTLSTFENGLPVALIEWAIEKAKRLLPPG
jgi:hypothetical protein